MSDSPSIHATRDQLVAAFQQWHREWKYAEAQGVVWPEYDGSREQAEASADYLIELLQDEAK
jgi:hypothetical protein